MRKNIVAGNWKMNKTLEEGTSLTSSIKELVFGQKLETTVIIAPPYFLIDRLVQIAKSSGLNIAAQNCATEEEGAYTGEVSAKMIASVGATHVIIGHSERRAYYHENNEVIRKKTDQVLKNNLIPIFCCGEVLEERDANKHYEVVKKQLEESLFHLSAEEFGKIVVAYEPVWAIGTGKTASPSQAQEMHAYIRKVIAEKYSKTLADKISILYGGSCKPSNAKEIFSQQDVDGGLIGGASLKAEDFVEIIKAF